MSKSRTEVLDEVVSMIANELMRIRVENRSHLFDHNTARIVAEFGRTLSLIDKNMSEKEAAAAAGVATLSNDELEAKLLAASKQIEERRRGSGAK